MSAARVYRWGLVSSVLAYALILLGGLVSATHSGMGCGPQWPLCNDSLVPIFNSRETFLEYMHRVVAGALVVTTVVLTRLAWRLEAARSLRTGSVVALVLLIVQALLGAVTVWMDLPPIVSTIHLVTSQIYLGALVLVTAMAAPRRVVSAASEGVSLRAGSGYAAAAAAVAPWAAGAAVVTLGVITLGALVKHHLAGLACGVQFPLCQGAAVPDPLSGTVLLHWSHRTAAYTAAILVLLTYAVAARRRPDAPLLFRWAAAAVVLVALQIGLGVATVLTRVNPALSVAHLGVATLLWVTLLSLAGGAWAPGLLHADAARAEGAAPAPRLAGAG